MLANSKLAKRILVVLIIVLIEGCAAVAVTGVATGASVAADRRTAGTYIEDEAIELKALQAFNGDKELSSQTHLNVTSYNTNVLVSGETPTEELRARAIELVRNLPKVSHVHDEIIIAAPSSLISRSSDTLITSKLKAKLIAAKGVDGMNIKIVTENGIVYLMGITDRDEAEKATNIARRTGGVQKVVKLFEYTD